MKHDLEQLLREADAAAPPPAERIDDLGASVRTRAHRRRRNIRFASGATAAMILLLLLLYRTRPPDAGVVANRPAPASSPVDAARQMALLAAEAERRTAHVEKLLAAERRAIQPRRKSGSDPVLALRREQDRAAYLLIYEAERLARMSNEKARAAEEYRRVLSLFPETHWASVARERLAEMGGASQGSNPGVIGITTSKELS